MTRIVAVAALYAAAVSAQEAGAPEVAVRAVRVERPQGPAKDGRQARMVMLVEKLASGELTEVERDLRWAAVVLALPRAHRRPPPWLRCWAAYTCAPHTEGAGPHQWALRSALGRVLL